jgi:hypothetical protein
MYTLEQNDKIGYYTVGTKKFYAKVEALIEATKVNQFPQWHFNTDVYGSIKWDHDPQVSLRELYRLRAVQLREKYDWIRIEASGGGDSTTALLSFLNNGIHIDEVVFRYPKTGEKNVHGDPFNTKCENTLSEWDFAAKPLLNWISTHHPRVKITVHDFTDSMVNASYEEDWVFRSKDYFLPSHPFKHDPIGYADHRKDADAGKKIAVLYGIDKPRVCVKDNKWYVYFMDLQANHSNSVVNEYNNITNEYFYWTPDLPEIVHKQAHMIKNWFMLPQNQSLQHLVKWPNNSIAARTTYEQVVKPILYPDYDPATFQTIKPTNSFYNEMDYWFYVNFKETRAYQIWKAGLKFLVDNIDQKYMYKEMGEPMGFVGFLSPFYYLGPATYVDTGVNNYARFDQPPTENIT